MANPVDPGTFDLWITNRIGFKTAPPKSGNTGDFDRWITDRIYWEDYVKTAVIAAALPENQLLILQAVNRAGTY